MEIIQDYRQTGKTTRLLKRANDVAIETGTPSCVLVHNGRIQHHLEGICKDFGYANVDIKVIHSRSIEELGPSIYNIFIDNTEHVFKEFLKIQGIKGDKLKAMVFDRVRGEDYDVRIIFDRNGSRYDTSTKMFALDKDDLKSKIDEWIMDRLESNDFGSWKGATAFKIYATGKKSSSAYTRYVKQTYTLV